MKYEEPKLYKIVPCKVENRGNLKMIGIDYPIEFQSVKNMLVVHIKEDLSSNVVNSISMQLRSIFGENVVLFALKKDISFFIAKPMTTKEVNDLMKETLSGIV